MPSSHSGSSHSSGGFSGGSFGGGFGGSSFHSSPSFHSSSSHSSSGYHSSSYGSSPSSHSSSSHSSASHSSGLTSEYSKIVTPRQTETPESRAEIRRQAHSDDWSVMKTVLIYHYLFGNKGRDAKYDYYPHGYTDKQDVYYRPGYYNTETGKRYQNIIMPGVKNIVTCPHCNKQFFHKWDSEATSPMDVTCPFCEKDITVHDIEKEEFYSDDETYTPEERKRQAKETASEVIPKILLGVLITAIVVGIGYGIFKWVDWAGRHKPELTSNYNSNSGYQTSPAQTTQKDNELYVKPLGRYCQYDGENYYDPETDSYFWFNTNIDPPQWQYWFEGISSQYGNYGWMEYDDDKQQWFIEVADNKWEQITFDDPRAWHFEDAYQDPKTMNAPASIDVSDNSITETVSYKNLEPGQTYTLIGTVYAKEDPTDDYSEAIAQNAIEFTPESSNGYVDITIDLPCVTSDLPRYVATSMSIDKKQT